jgi:hypothetical protein
MRTRLTAEGYFTTTCFLLRNVFHLASEAGDLSYSRPGSQASNRLEVGAVRKLPQLMLINRCDFCK